MSRRQVAVLGLGMTGLSCVNFLTQDGYQVTVFDTRDNPPGADKLDQTTTLITGPLDAEQLVQFKLIISSPGIALSTPALQVAAQAGCEIIGDIELFARALKKAPYQHAKLVTITGSNGKSTVTDLLGVMAVESNIKVAIGGNFGIPALDLLAPEIQLYVLELSSFQLETTFSLNADIATILNISEDHLNRYNSYQHYAQTKHRIFDQTKKALFNRDDSLTKPKNIKQAQLSFGFDDKEYGLIVDRDKITYLAKNGQTLLAVSLLKLSGKHNWMNALASYALGDEIKLDKAAMIKALQKYTGLAHRCEFVAEVNGVRWVNDSKGTNIGATEAALLGLSDIISGKVHVILGGDGKGADFSELIPALDEIKGEIVCFGKDGGEIAAINPRATLVENLDQAVELIAKNSSEGDLAILTPACASLDMYSGFVARGEHFRKLVHSLADVDVS